MYKNNFKYDLDKSIEESLFPKNKILFLHIKLKTLKIKYSLSYEKITSIIIDTLKVSCPKNIIVPAFTHSFTKNKVFDLYKSKSEVGLFSELFRKNYSKYRTFDPIFSLSHLNNYKEQYKNINFLSAFNKNSIWEYFNNSNDTIIVNIGLDHLITSQIHYIEYICNVPYRSEIIKKGSIIDNKINININYNFYARKLEEKLGLNWEKITNLLINREKLYYKENCPINLKWFKIKEITDILIPEINKDPYFLVQRMINKNE